MEIIGYVFLVIIILLSIVLIITGFSDNIRYTKSIFADTDIIKFKIEPSFVMKETYRNYTNRPKIRKEHKGLPYYIVNVVGNGLKEYDISDKDRFIALKWNGRKPKFRLQEGDIVLLYREDVKQYYLRRIEELKEAVLKDDRPTFIYSMSNVKNSRYSQMFLRRALTDKILAVLKYRIEEI